MAQVKPSTSSARVGKEEPQNSSLVSGSFYSLATTEPAHSSTSMATSSSSQHLSAFSGALNVRAVAGGRARSEGSSIRKGMLHSTRLSSFLENGWPKERVKENGVLCTPQELALAGLEFVSNGVGRCVICWKIVPKLEPSTDPWERHRQVSPTCPFIKLGKPDEPDGYSLAQFLTLLAERQAYYQEVKYLELEDHVNCALVDIYKLDNAQPNDSIFEDSF